MTSHYHLFVVCLSLYLCSLSSSDRNPVVTSIVRMSKLAQFERDLITFVRKKSYPLPIQFVNFISFIEEEHFKVYNHSLSFIDFPINQYRVIRRFSYDWPLWQKELQDHVLNKTKISSSASQFLTFYGQQSKSYNETDKFDPYFDLSVASITIARLHILYRQKTGLLSDDEFNGCPPLSQVELLELVGIAEAAASSEVELYYAFHWMTLFIERMKKHLPYSSVLYMAEYVLRHSDIYGRPSLHQRTLEFGSRKKRMKRLIRLMQKYPHHLNVYFEIFDQSFETRVCRLSEDRSQSGNYCFLFRSPRAPYAPFKYEILHRNPYIAVVHNFIPLGVAKNFISTAIAEGSERNQIVSRYSLVNGQPVTEVKVKIRLSESTIFENNHFISAWIDLRVEQSTLLLPHSQPTQFGVRDGEEIHILHYGLSGHYRPHYDYFAAKEYTKDIGNRLATVLIYLTDVHSGGHTAFPYLNVSFTPRAGSALVWFNLDPLYGSYLRDTLHVACPVNIGKKWVVNRWIRTHLKTGHSRPIFK